jgi:hypothetical protein
LTLIDSLVSDNRSGGAGGGIANIFSNSTTMLMRTTVTRNSAQAGAGIQNFQGRVTLSQNSTVSANTASRPAPIGGGVRNDGGPLTVEPGSSIVGNTPDNCLNVNGGGGCPP